MFSQNELNFSFWNSPPWSLLIHKCCCNFHFVITRKKIWKMRKVLDVDKSMWSNSKGLEVETKKIQFERCFCLFTFFPCFTYLILLKLHFWKAYDYISYISLFKWCMCMWSILLCHSLYSLVLNRKHSILDAIFVIFNLYTLFLPFYLQTRFSLNLHHRSSMNIAQRWLNNLCHIADLYSVRCASILLHTTHVIANITFFENPSLIIVTISVISLMFQLQVNKFWSIYSNVLWKNY